MLHWIRIEWLRLRITVTEVLFTRRADRQEKMDAVLWAAAKIRDARRERLQLQGTVQAPGLPSGGVPEARPQSPRGPLVP